jgi:hypothetical protein
MKLAAGEHKGMLCSDHLISVKYISGYDSCTCFSQWLTTSHHNNNDDGLAEFILLFIFITQILSFSSLLPS